MELTPVQLRILGCLVEKERTTPDNYPLSTNALVNACNQTSNRDPVVSYDERTVDASMLELRTEGLARTVTGGRANKHRHVLDEAWAVSDAEVSVLALLFLRGPQTVGELRGRAERLHEFDDLDQVERTLEALSERAEPFVVQLDRQPGQKERRWAHLLGDDTEAQTTSPATSDMSREGARHQSATYRESPREPATEAPTDPDQELRAEVERLRADVDRLYELLGESPPAAP